MPIAITINGESRAVSEGETLLGVVRSLGLDPRRVAVELDGAIIKQARWQETVLRPGAALEIVHFVGGG